jgi:hypothetical protein
MKWKKPCHCSSYWYPWSSGVGSTMHLLLKLFLILLLLLKQRIFCKLSILLIPEKFLATVLYSYGWRTSEQILPHKEEPTRQCVQHNCHSILML